MDTKKEDMKGGVQEGGCRKRGKREKKGTDTPFVSFEGCINNATDRLSDWVTGEAKPLNAYAYKIVMVNYIGLSHTILSNILYFLDLSHILYKFCLNYI